jgi:anthranilate synthase/aminodeoxychorismate synthase-like glutamine amidotransferase
VRVVKNDQVTLAEIGKQRPRGILISPGPGRPSDSGISPEVVRQFSGHIPLLGICLGHQLIGELLGGSVVQSPTPVHGKTSLVSHTGLGLFSGLPQPLRMMRYHSLLIAPDGLPQELEVTAWAEKGEIMAIQHKLLPLAGVQFHPESILSEKGEQILFNWMGSL